MYKVERVTGFLIHFNRLIKSYPGVDSGAVGSLRLSAIG